MNLAATTKEAELFDRVALHQRKGEDIELWTSFASAARGPVLELGAGTARVLAPLLTAGIDAYGIEVNRRRRAAGMARLVLAGIPNAHERLVLGDMRSFDHPRSYDLMIVPYNSLALVHDADLKRTLGCLASHLAPGGTLVVEAQVWPRWLSLSAPWSRSTGPWPLQLGEMTVQYRERSNLDSGSGVLTVVQDFDFPDGSSTWREFALRIRALEEWDSLLLSAGWVRVGPAVDEHGRAPEADSRLVFLRASPLACGP